MGEGTGGVIAEEVVVFMRACPSNPQGAR
jgi:hypothetical protein